MGRPPGALGGNRRRGYPQDWELRDPVRYGERLQELKSDEDDGQGVILEPNRFATRERRLRGYAGDQLYFDGHDLGQDRGPRRGVYDEAYDDYISEEEEAYYRDQQRSAAYQNAGRARGEPLVQSALDRIARAREKGKTNVNLTPEEMDALQRRNSPQLEPASALASPPPTPKSRARTTSRNSSSSNLPAQKSRKKNSSGFFGSPAKSNSKAKMTRTTSAEQAIQYPPGSPAPGIMVPGPNGVPVYAPLAYYGPPSPEFARRSPSGGAGSRSSSKQSRRESTPPELYQALPHRYYPAAPRPESREGSSRPYPDDVDWYPPPPSRTRSASNAQYTGYRHPEDYDMAPPGPAAQGRRHASGPPDVRYANLRRAPPSSSPLATRSQPAGSALRRVETSSSSSSSEDQGVQVDIVPDDNGGYQVRSIPNPNPPAPIPAGPSTSKGSGNEARKRKSGRR
ncbi:Hypothetical predicted protein [Lecanosticta acicola]|uniref:Uncharacterized protein n=1 Tax=Lecanosticta acicola TaxID=111012 RepID=A0AAI8Z0A9_9PEZI|nr:Hypothetical predicted protein [Lecanosticta acicola]